MTWPAGRHPTGPPVDEVAPRAAPGTYPVPDGRGRWRVTLHNRVWDTSQGWQQALVAELTAARGRRLTQQWCQSALFTFTVDGGSTAAAMIQELMMDVIVWRWDDQTGADVAMFRGVIAQSEDQLTEQSNVVTFTCHDYFAMLMRRYHPAFITYGDDPDRIVGYTLPLGSMLRIATRMPAIGGSSTGGGVAYTFYSPGSYLPLTVALANPDGTSRGLSGQYRVRQYALGKSIGEAIDELAKVINGFDYDVQPGPQVGSNTDQLRLFYPYQGTARSNPALVYGSTVATVTRSTNSADYANDVIALGADNPNSTAGGQFAQYVSEASNIDSNNVAVHPIGLWQVQDNAADVTVQTTLDDKAGGDLQNYGVLTPTYTLGLRPGAYSFGNPNMGDVVPLIIQSGRLNVNTAVRVLGIDYDIGDDGQEDVILTVGRPATSLARLLKATHSDVAALTRR